MMSVRAAAAIEPVGNVTAALGEGPYWVPEDDCLLWVDIEGGRLHRTYFPSAETVTDSLSAVSAAFPAVGGGILTVGGAALTLLFAVFILAVNLLTDVAHVGLDPRLSFEAA